jgi:hypothetical protein
MSAQLHGPDPRGGPGAPDAPPARPRGPERTPGSGPVRDAADTGAEAAR